MAKHQETNPVEIPLEPEEAQVQPPLSGTVDDDDDTDDEHWDENEAPERALSDETDTRKEFRLDEREEGAEGEADDEDDEDDDDADDEDDDDADDEESA